MFKKALFLAAIGALISFVYPSLYYFVWNFYSIATSRHFTMNWFVVTVFGQFMYPVAVTVFLIFLYMEALELVGAGGRRRAAMFSAVFMVLGAVFIVWEMRYTMSLRSAPHVTLAFSIRQALLRQFFLGLIPFIGWVVFLVIFAKEMAPFHRPSTRYLALLLAIGEGLRSLWDAPNRVGALIRLWSQLGLNPPGKLRALWAGILAPAIFEFSWISLVVFLVVVWRNLPRREPADGAPVLG